MSDLKICRICLRTEAKVYKIDRYQLKSYYEEIMGVRVYDNDVLPKYFCYECAMLLHKFHKFKEKCYCGQKILRDLLIKEGQITYEFIYKIEKKDTNLEPLVNKMVVTKNNKMFIVKDDEMCSKTNSLEKIEVGSIECNPLLDISDTEKPIEKPASPVSVFLDVKNEPVELESKEILDKSKSNVRRRNIINSRRIKLLDAGNWKKLSLNEEDAVREFRLRSENPKYLKSDHKCRDCYKGFSKSEMLRRHIHLKHSLSRGRFECRICHARFKYSGHLRTHTTEHYTKYQCLRCNFVCALEYSALLHNELHSGISKKCVHCGEEFRHTSTYYTHLRTSHRSGHVCARCGGSFVSSAGLHMHTKVKHIDDDIESPDDYEEINTYCKKCDIRFETRNAYEVHLFHSVMHEEGVEDEVEDEATVPRKINGKRERAKVTKELNQGKSNVCKQPEVKRQRKLKRKRKKPMTCYQCGSQFETQAACLRHHVAQHPRTSFFPPADRYVCEICGASLAPGSIAMHQNMHTREKTYSCDTCGKQFHAVIGLKRHLVTHTGEKPYGCSLCDKRFTQSNSMKLHYRTFHLKQPYPKRNRIKNKVLRQESKEAHEEMESDSEESLPEPELKLPEPKVIEPVLNAIPEVPDETVQYYTLN